jgi:hypothetical protein
VTVLAVSSGPGYGRAPGDRDRPDFNAVRAGSHTNTISVSESVFQARSTNL